LLFLEAVMAVEVTYPHIEKKPGEPARFARFPRFRLAILIGAQQGNGWSAEELCQSYPDLKPSEIYSALAYYHDHREEIDAEIQADLEAFEKARESAPPSPIAQKLRAQGLL
jgi:hypothetical protein